MKTISTLLKGAALAGGLAFATIASADELPSAPASPDDGMSALSLEDMDALAGGTGVDIVVITDQTLTATNTGNTVTGDVVGSGQVTLGSGAFNGYSGLGNFVINTGHNNNLQSSMNVSVVLAPQPGPTS
ncbi:MAG: hypothetical protein K2X34_00945 [Hyphomonadaceae bacterium]|nr:hypothetical protein [Hyphomonadaceae bacterium]